MTLEPTEWIFDGRIPECPTAMGLRELLDALIRATGLTPIPDLQYVLVRNPTWQAFQGIAESHIILHGEPPDAAYADVFSCRAFDPETVLDLLVEYLHGEWIGRRARPKPEEGEEIPELRRGHHV